MKKFSLFVILMLTLTLLCSSLCSCAFFVKDVIDGVQDGMNGDSLGKADTPFGIEYLSNGDGTCKASVTVNSLYREEFELVIPDSSPDGDTVTEVDFAQPFEDITASFPTVITTESFNKLKEALAANLEGGTQDRIYMRVTALFISYNIETMKDIVVKAALRDYPFLEYTKSAYFFDEYADAHEVTMVRKYLEEYAKINVKEFAYAEYKSITDTLTANGVPENELDEYIPEYNRYVEAPTSMYITSVKLPSGLTKLHADDIENLAVCGYVYDTQKNGVKTMLSRNEIVVPESAGSEVLTALLRSDIEKLLLMASEVPDYEKSGDEYTDSENERRIFTYSETPKSQSWKYVDGVPTT